MPSKKKMAPKPQPKKHTPNRLPLSLVSDPDERDKRLAEMARKEERAKKRTTKRSAVSGRFGSDEKALDALARRITDIVDELGFGRETEQRIKAKLRAATTVTETAAEAIGEGWVWMERGEPVKTDYWKGDGSEYVCVYASQRPPIDREWSMQYVRLIPASPPKAAKARRG